MSRETEAAGVAIVTETRDHENCNTADTGAEILFIVKTELS